MTKHVMLDEIIDICKRKGQGFETSVEASLAAGDSLKTIFVTGSKPVIFYSRKISYDGVGINTRLYREPEYTGGSQTIEAYNANDGNPANSESVFISGSTINNDGTLTRAPVNVFGNSSNQGKGDALQVIDEPQKMMPGRTFNFVLENRDTNNPQTVFSIVGWVEADRIPGWIIQNGNFVAYNGAEL